MDNELLNRYNADQRRVIEEYWETIRFTRRTCKITDGVREKEMSYWTRFPSEVVIQALQIHISKYPNVREQYTRGIIRNLAREKEGGYGVNKSIAGETGKRTGGHSKNRERNARAADAFKNRI